MRLSELARSAGAEISSHKGRSAMTCLSLSIGIAAVLFTFSQVDGLRHRFDKAIELSGPGRIQIKEKRGYTSRGLSPGLTWEDSQAIREHWPGLYMVYAMKRRWGARFSFETYKFDDMVIWGTTEEWSKRNWVFTQEGRFFNAEDIASAARVCVIIEPGGWVVKPFWAKYFPEMRIESMLKRRSMVGRQVRIEDHLFTVAGILREPPRDKDPRWNHSAYGGSGNILVPITTYQRYLIPSHEKKGHNRVQEIEVETGSAETIGTALRNIEGLLNARHRGEKDFEIKDYRQLIEGRMKRLRERAVTIMVIGIVAVLASGIGIMNVTLATIYSRIREIGIRRALGATKLDIISQFVSEAMTLGLFASAVGTGLGMLAVKYLSPDPDWAAPLNVAHFGWALAISLGTGFLFSLFPAYQASRYDPVEALRYE